MSLFIDAAIDRCRVLCKGHFRNSIDTLKSNQFKKSIIFATKKNWGKIAQKAKEKYDNERS